MEHKEAIKYAGMVVMFLVLLFFTSYVTEGESTARRLLYTPYSYQ